MLGASPKKTGAWRGIRRGLPGWGRAGWGSQTSQTGKQSPGCGGGLVEEKVASRGHMRSNCAALSGPPREVLVGEASA